MHLQQYIVGIAKGQAATGLLTGGKRIGEGIQNGNTAEVVMGAVETVGAGVDVAASFKNIKGAGAVGTAVTVIDGAYQVATSYDSNKSTTENALVMGDKAVEVGVVAASNIYTIGMAGNAGAVLYDRLKEQQVEQLALMQKTADMMSGKIPMNAKELARDFADMKLKDAQAGLEAIRQSTPGQLVENSYKIIDASIETAQIYAKEAKRFDNAFNSETAANVRYRLGKEIVEVLKEDGAVVKDGKLIMKDGKTLELAGDGSIRDIDEINFKDPKNITILDRALDKKIASTQKIHDDNWTMKWWGETLDKRKNAESDLAILKSAKNAMPEFQAQAERLSHLEKQMNEMRASVSNISKELNINGLGMEATTLDKDGDGKISIAELNIGKSKDGKSNNVLDQDDLMEIRKIMGANGNKEAAERFEKSLAASGVKFDGSVAVNTPPAQTPAGETRHTQLAAR